jgi:ubiquinone/menaquinone biosynthesis C-methylase UbiE
LTIEVSLMSTVEPRKPQPGSTAIEIVTAITMTVGRGPAARAIADAAGVTDADLVADIGCGPGTAVREAARRGARAVGIDPSDATLWLADRISALRRADSVSWTPGRAEALPLADDSVTIVWSLSSAHHWSDLTAALGEIRRVLVPGGKVLIAERLTRPGARGLAAHGFTSSRADSLAEQMTAAGFADVRIETLRAGRRNLIIVSGGG